MSLTNIGEASLKYYEENWSSDVGNVGLGERNQNYSGLTQEEVDNIFAQQYAIEQINTYRSEIQDQH